jgi:hypothetical protein
MTLSIKHSPKTFIDNVEAKQRSPTDRQRPYLPAEDGNILSLAVL